MSRDTYNTYIVLQRLEKKEEKKNYVYVRVNKCKYCYCYIINYVSCTLTCSLSDKNVFQDT